MRSSWPRRPTRRATTASTCRTTCSSPATASRATPTPSARTAPRGSATTGTPTRTGPTRGASSRPWRRSPSTCEFTTGVYVAPARDLVTVAKQVGTAAVISSGRVALGVGVGWCEEEFDATGQDFSHPGQAARRHDPRAAGPVGARAGGWVEYHGPIYDVPAMRMEPSPPGPIPIIGGGPLRAGPAPGGDVVRRLGGGRRLQARRRPGATSAQLAEQRRRAGRENEPFSIYLSLWVAPRRRPVPELRRGLRRHRHPVRAGHGGQGRPVGSARGAAADTPRRIGALRR